MDDDFVPIGDEAPQIHSDGFGNAHESDGWRALLAALLPTPGGNPDAG